MIRMYDASIWEKTCLTDLVLEIDRLSVGYAGSIVISDLSLSLKRGESLAVLGRNGVGKSTLLLAIMGHLQPRSGSIWLLGADLTRASPTRRCRSGVGWVPQGREIFPPLTVDENLRIAASAGHWTVRRVYDLFPRLMERCKFFAGHLSGGEQQMLAIGRALVTNPALLLLDEPLEGLAPIVGQDVGRQIAQLVEKEGMSTILVEQNVGFALGLTHQAIILERGVTVRRGKSQEVAQDRDALAYYVGLRKPGGTPGA
jgi:branched-chain amino acid transport system ATP-binding protein